MTIIDKIRDEKLQYNLDKDIKLVEKKLFQSNIGLFFPARKKFLVTNKLFPIKKSRSGNRIKIGNIIKIENRNKIENRIKIGNRIKIEKKFFKKIVNKKLFRNYYKYQIPSYLAKDLFKADKKKKR